MPDLATAPAATTPTISTPAGDLPAVKVEHGAFPPPPQKVAAMAKLIALREADKSPSPFDAPNPGAGATPASTSTTPATAPKVDAAPRPDAAKIEMDATTLRRLTALSKENREAKAKLAQLEGSSKDAATFAEVKKLYAEGKRLEAIAKFTGKDGVAEMEALMSDYLNAPTTDAKDEASTALAAKVDELIARDTQREKAATEAAERTRTQQVTAFAHHVLDSVTDGSLEICARPENRAEAAEAALAIVVALAQDRKITDLTPEVATDLYREAYTTVEAEYAALGQRYSRGTPQPTSGQRDPRIATRSPPAAPPQTRPTPTLQKSPIATTNQRPLTTDEHKARAIEAMRSARR